jgi:hypothetical protein
MAYRLNGKFVSKEIYESAMTGKEGNNMDVNAIIHDDNEILDSEIPFDFSGIHLLKDDTIADHAEELVTDALETISNDPLDELQEYSEEDENKLDELLQECKRDAKLIDNEISYELITVGEFAKMKLNAEIAYQRPIVWKDEQRDLLIDSILRGYNIGTIYVHGNNLLDGKQRNNCIGLTVSGMYQPSTLGDDYAELNGLMIGNWDREYQEAFFNAKILLVRLPESWDEDRAIEQFIRLNRGGRPLTIAQARRGRMIDKIMALSSCINHPVFDMECKDSKDNSVCIYGKIGKAWKEDIIIKLCNSLYGNNDYVAKNLIEWFIKWNMPTHVIKEIASRLLQFKAIMNVVLKQDNGAAIGKKIAKKTHVSAILAALDDKMDSNTAGMNLHEFFSRQKENKEFSEYKKLCEAGTADPVSVTARIATMRRVMTH